MAVFRPYREGRIPRRRGRSQPDEMTTKAAPTVTRDEALGDYRVAYLSRQASVIGRREVMTGKAKFGIFGDGKELAQVAMAKVFERGDWRSGYYRDQTLFFALGILSVEQFFAQLYADPDPERDPSSAGRQMNCHFATRLLDDDGGWRPQVEMHNSAADLSPVAAQMPRLAGLAYASRLYRTLPELGGMTGFSRQGNEIAFGTIGNASCAEGMFWETLNAVGVLQAPMLLSIWDDGYGISVPNEFQLVRHDLGALLGGFARRPGEKEGFDLHTVRGWDYEALLATYRKAAATVRAEHVPAILHVTELTQPQGHSTSGSHERYKSKERLDWERAHDCLQQMRWWLTDRDLATGRELDELEKEATAEVRRAQQRAWEAFTGPIQAELDELAALGDELAAGAGDADEIRAVVEELRATRTPLRRQAQVAARSLLLATLGRPGPARDKLVAWKRDHDRAAAALYDSHLVSESAASALAVAEVAPVVAADAPLVNGFEIVNQGFDALFARHPNLFAFGEDVGHLGDVNQGLAGLQKKYGLLRITDTGIRECTILGQAIGMALRGLRPIAEIQYLDYLHYALQLLSDDLATLRYRTRGGQQAPVVVRTRGHRLEGIWHSGSPMAGILNLVRGVWVCVPRNMTQAAGFYNTLLRSDDSGIVVEVLNGYRRKERLPSNLADVTVPLGVPEVLRPGGDVTLVTYGACCPIAVEAAELLGRVGIEVEVIDVRTLLPFDRVGTVVGSLRRTNRVVFLDEDVPGGATAFLLQQVLEAQRGFDWLDAGPRTVTAKEHRPAYGSDGDYFSKPSVENVFDAVYELMREARPDRYPSWY
jgi:pyruvate/2-oxoglutarate/acetoin dehydrogenase E1 component/TPP-dependent pyruvate/acetoin dehydrogenase alpha subunit